MGKIANIFLGPFRAPLKETPRSTFHGYAAAVRMRPEWRTAFLVFQGGAPKTRGNSITGGGQIYGHEFMAMQHPNVIVTNSPGVPSLVGGGQIVGTPPEIIALLGGVSGVGS